MWPNLQREELVNKNFIFFAVKGIHRQQNYQIFKTFPFKKCSENRLELYEQSL